MAIALPLLDHLFMPVNHAVQWLSGAPAAPATPSPAAAEPAAVGAGLARARSHVRPAASSRPARRWGGPARTAIGPRPLRVVHVPESRAPREAAGRLLISGRLDDVFAELDRLVRDHERVHAR